MLLREIILENWMSYEYARIPLREGLNIICGPNGSGKSSILLAISVALGQAYTERGRKLSDLIRWGKDTARVTLVFDNKAKDGKRPIPKFDTDYFRLTRYLKKKGDYWFQVNFRTATKSEVVNLLSEFGINPDNMLIIMQQHMMEEFGATTTMQKLIMVEDAVGFREYREKVLEAQMKLTQVLSEEESVSNLLKNAEQTLVYWKGEYDRYQRRKELLVRKSFLKQELIWSQLNKQERIVESWKEKMERKDELLVKVQDEINVAQAKVSEFKDSLSTLRGEEKKLCYLIQTIEKKKTRNELALNTLNETLDKIKNYEKKIMADLKTGASYSELKQDVLKISSGHSSSEILNKETMQIDINKHFGSSKMLDRKLDEQQSKVQMLKCELDKLEDEQALLEKLKKDKVIKENTLQQNKKRLKKLSAITDQISPKLLDLRRFKEQISSGKIRTDGIKKQLSLLLRRLPENMIVGSVDDPVELAKEISSSLMSEIEKKKTIRELIAKTDVVVQSATDKQQTLIASIRIYENEIKRFSKQKREIQLYVDGSSEKPQIQCDKCGSILTPDQWINHLSEVDDDIQTSMTLLTPLRIELKENRKRLFEKKSELDSLHQDEQMLGALHSLSTQANQLLNDVTGSSETMKKLFDDQNKIILNIVKIIEFDRSKKILVDVVEQRIKHLQTEERTLKLETSFLDQELSSFEELHLKPQRGRVDKALRALEDYRKIIPQIMDNIRLFISDIKFQSNLANQQMCELKENLSFAQIELDKIDEKLNSATDCYSDEKARESSLKFRKGNLENEIYELGEEFNKAQITLDQLQPLADQSGVRIETERNSIEISADIRVIGAQLISFTEVSEDIEVMYKNYQSLCNELKDKSIIVSDNRDRAFQEIDERKEIWKNLLKSLLDSVNPIFKSFLEKIRATGWVNLVNTQDIEMAGLELIVGFKGAEPHVLDWHIQSGGERSSATMAFLLALQRHVKSPFRAIDEFDVHMDPRNRELISQMLLKEIENESQSQYLSITPSQLTNVGEKVHVITVQNVQGRSEIKMVT